MTATGTSNDDKLDGYRYPRRDVHGFRGSQIAGAFPC
jgi:hypothetical protein